MTTTTQAHVAPVTTYDFVDALKAARGTEDLSPRQRHALENPPASFRVDETDAAADGYFAARGRVDVFAYAHFVLTNHRSRRVHIEAAVAGLRDKIALPLERIERLGREIAALRSVPDELAALLDLGRNTPPGIAADRFESAALRIATEAQRNTRARVI